MSAKSKFGCYTAVLIFNILLGGWSVNYLLSLASRNIPFWADTAIGLFTAQITFPVAAVIAILKHFGVF